MYNAVLPTGLLNRPVFTTWSRDQGRHWSDVQKVTVGEKVILGIFPRLVVMDNGVLAFITSRPGQTVVFGDGIVWTNELILYKGQGTMNAMRQIAPNTLLAIFNDARRHFIAVPITVTKE